VTSPMLSSIYFDELLERDGVTLSSVGTALVEQELNKVREQATA